MHPAFAVRVAKRLGIDLMRLLDEDPPAPPPPPSDGRARVIPLAERRQLDTAIGGAVTPPGPPDVT